MQLPKYDCHPNCTGLLALNRFVARHHECRFVCLPLQEKTTEDAASKAKMESAAKQKDTELADARKELARAQETLAALRIQSDLKLEQALEDAAQRSQQEQVALRSELEAELQQIQASQRIAADRFTIQQAAIVERAERAEYDSQHVHTHVGLLGFSTVISTHRFARVRTGIEHKQRKANSVPQRSNL